MVAEEDDEFRWAFRVAAYNVIQADAKEAHARAKSHQGVGGSTRRSKR